MTLFYPLVQGHPDWAFAQDFHDRYLRGLAGADEVVDLDRGRHGNRRPARRPRPPSRLRPRFPAPGARLSVAPDPGTRSSPWPRTCSGCVEQEGFDFRHVGVVARTLEPYLPWVQEIFPEHGIPFHTPAREPLRRFNRVRAVLTLLDLPVRDYPRAAVIDLLASHDFNFNAVLGPRRRAQARSLGRGHPGIAHHPGHGRMAPPGAVRPRGPPAEPRGRGGRRPSARRSRTQIAALLKIVATPCTSTSAPCRKRAGGRSWRQAGRPSSTGSSTRDRTKRPPAVAKAIDQAFAALAALEAINPDRARWTPSPGPCATVWTGPRCRSPRVSRRGSR